MAYAMPQHCILLGRASGIVLGTVMRLDLDSGIDCLRLMFVVETPCFLLGEW